MKLTWKQWVFHPFRTWHVLQKVLHGVKDLQDNYQANPLSQLTDKELSQLIVYQDHSADKYDMNLITHTTWQHAIRDFMKERGFFMLPHIKSFLSGLTEEELRNFTDYVLTNPDQEFVSEDVKNRVLSKLVKEFLSRP